MKHLGTLVLFATTVFLSGCGADSLLPWLDESSVVSCNREWTGEWFVGEDEQRIVVEVKEKTFTMNGEQISPEKYRIYIYDSNGQKVKSLSAHLHNINDVQLLQIHNFGGPSFDEIASVNTYSLWQIEGDSDNLVLWIPGFVTDILSHKTTSPVKFILAGHEHEQPIFVDSTVNLKSFITTWTMTYVDSNVKLPIELHRKGKEFKMPNGIKRIKAEPAPPAGRGEAPRP